MGTIHILCVRVSETDAKPVTPSSPARCGLCEEVVWISNQVLVSMPPLSSIAPICTACVRDGRMAAATLQAASEAGMRMKRFPK